MRELIIDPEFRDKIPPLTEAELKQLEENILADGEVISPIVVWNNVIVDGHNRWGIIQIHPELPHKYLDKDFADRYEAIVWICRSQLGRRNLTDEQKTYLIGKQYEAQKLTVGNQAHRGPDGRYLGCQNDTKGSNRTRDQIAKEHGIGTNTVIRAERFAKGVDAAESVAPGIKNKILSGKTMVPKTVVSEIPKMKEEDKAEVVDAIMNDSYKRPTGKTAKSTNPDGYNTEMRKTNSIIEKAVADMYDTDRQVEHTVDHLLEEFEALVEDFIKKAKRTMQNYSTVLSDEESKKKVIAALGQAETAIGKIKELIS